LNDFANALPYIERLRNLFSRPELDEEDPSIKAEWLAMQATLLSGQGQLEESLLLSELALAALPAEDAYVRTLIYNLLANTYKQLNDPPRAIEAYEKLIQHGRAAGDFVAELMGLTGLALYVMQRGDLHAAHALATQGLERVESLGVYLPISAAIYGEMGAILYSWNRIDEAQPYFARAAQVSTLSGYSDAEIYHAVIRSRQAMINGDLPTAVREIEEAEAVMAAYAPAAVSEELLAQQVRVALATGHPAEAEALLRPLGFTFGPTPAFPTPSPGRFIQFEMGLLAVSALRILLQQARRAGNPDLHESLRLADQLIEQSSASHLLPILVETLLVRAQLHGAGGDPAAARADVREALALARPSGAITLFLAEGAAVAAVLAELLAGSQLEDSDRGWAAQILAAFPDPIRRAAAPPAATAASLAEPLSRRELDVLRLIDEGCTNHEIAERLVITLHTVKKHSSNLYAKLGVGSRTQALARARELGLL
jgi:LuxR family maltose regulon positive regulatory protein